METNVIKKRTPHLSSLKQRHTALETTIHEESLRPMPDFLTIQRLKRERLALKEMIVRLERETRQPVVQRELKDPA